MQAERALVAAQVKGWRAGNPWGAWEVLYRENLTQYGALLEKERFAEIERMAARLAH